jgi:hypothetical protein
MGPGSHRFAFLAVASMPAFGCAAQVSAHAQATTSGPEEDRRWETPAPAESAAPVVTPAAQPSAPAPPPPDIGELPTAGTSFASLGVVHDLSLRPDAVQGPSCACLAVAWGDPQDPRFAWEAGVPNVDQGVVAIAISGKVPCHWSGGKGKPVPSIAGVGREGDDIVITVEAATGGRPVVRGVLAVQPSSASHLVVRARGNLPFGKPAAGGPGPCRVAMK